MSRVKELEVDWRLARSISRSDDFSDADERYTYENLRELARSLNRKDPKALGRALGETLLCYSHDWQMEVERLTVALAMASKT